MRATYNGQVIAESEDTVVVEGNHYFPEAALKREFVVPSNHRTSDRWKGQAYYYSLLVDGDLCADAVWYYPEPLEAAAEIKGRVAFGKGVQVVDGDSSESPADGTPEDTSGHLRGPGQSAPSGRPRGG